MYAQFFGTFLLSHNAITKDQLITALNKKTSEHIRIGSLAILKGYMTASEVDHVIILQTHEDKLFGELAVSRGYLTEPQLHELLQMQYPDFLLLGQTLVDDGCLSNIELENLIAQYESENELYDLDYNEEKKESLDQLVSNFLQNTDVSFSRYESSYIRLLFNDLIRFIGEDFTPLYLAPCSEYVANYCVSQKIIGCPLSTVYIDMPESACVHFASRYVHEDFHGFDEYVQASIEDFLNLHNGLYNVNVSNKMGTELTLEPPEISSEDIVTLTSNSYMLQVMYPFGMIHFLFQVEQPNIQSKESIAK